MYKCEEESGRMRCYSCKNYHSYYGCLSETRGMKGFVQIEQKPSVDLVQNDNKSKEINS